MNRLAGLVLAILGIAIAGCTNGNDHERHEDMNHEGTSHGSMSHERGHSDHDTGAALPAGANTVCPVMGDAVDPEIHTEYKGRKVYFCCDDCIGKFQDSPEKYFAKAYPDAGK